MQDSLTKVKEDAAALDASLAELEAQLSADQVPTLADNVLSAVTALLVAQGWTPPVTQVEVTEG